MAGRKELIARRLAEEGEGAFAFFEGLSVDQWGQRIYSEGSRWTLRQVLCHFVSAERGFLLLARDILNGGAGAPEGMDVDVFNEREVADMGTQTPQDLLLQFRRLRDETITLVQGLDESDFDREGRHPYFGRSSLEKLFKLVYRHNMLHLRDVRRVLDEG